MSAMVPPTDWNAAAREFTNSIQREPQVILCARCVTELGVTTPPAQVVISGGMSTCLDHLNRKGSM